MFDTIDRVAKGDIRLKIRDILGAFMFGGEASEKKVSVLSGGEKSRLAMIRLLLEPVNLLILDEPTTGLDPQTRQLIWNVIEKLQKTENMTVLRQRLNHRDVLTPNTVGYLVVIDGAEGVFLGQIIESYLNNSDSIHDAMAKKDENVLHPNLKIKLIGH